MSLRSSSTRRFILLAFALAGLIPLAGCQGLGWLAQGIAGGDKPEVEAAADYTGLANKSVAVLVSADDRTLFSFPDAPNLVCKYVTARLAADVVGIRPLDPVQVAKFQRSNPDWIVVPYGELAHRLKVDRIVHINLAQYTTNEPGNQELWQGVIRARVGISEADGKDASNFVYTGDISAIYPPDKPMGILNSDSETIQLGTVRAFAKKVAARVTVPPPSAAQ